MERSVTPVGAKPADQRDPIPANLEGAGQKKAEAAVPKAEAVPAPTPSDETLKFAEIGKLVANRLSFIYKNTVFTRSLRG